MPKLKLKFCLMALLGSAILAFGLYEVHAISRITEGGVLGLTLLLRHWFGISPAFSGIVIDAACYVLGWRLLGNTFLGYSFFASGGFSVAYAIFERFPPLWPGLADHPLSAALAGAVLIGVGAGVCVRAGGAPGGDDALAMSLSHVTHLRIAWIYLASDLTVLALSLSYIPLRRMAYSLLTVVLSGQIIGWIDRLGRGQKQPAAAEEV